MENNDVMNALNEKFGEAIKNGDTKAFIDTMNTAVNKSAIDAARDAVMAEYKRLGEINDERILAQRGMHVLTSEEKDFYNKLMTPKDAAHTGIELTLPVTVENRVFDNLEQEHPLLAAVDFVDSKGVTKWVLPKDLNYASKWGALNSNIDTEIAYSFKVIEFNNYKLSAFVTVPNDMLDLGVTFLDMFVVRYLRETIARALEKAIVVGKGQNEPLGMICEINDDPSKQARPATHKSATAITDLSVATIGAIAGELTNGGTRSVGVIDMVCNPADYWTIVYPALYHTDTNGNVAKANLPLNVYPSMAVDKGKAVFGLLKNYFATVGFGKNGSIKYSDDIKFLEDVRVYKAKCIAYGTPVDNTSFVYKDISGVKPAAFAITSKGTAEVSVKEVKGTVNTKASA